jgi:nitrous oxide reductase accessory protein NosL
MKWTTIVGTVAAGVGLLMGTAAAFAAEQREMQITREMECKICGMYINEFKKTAVEVNFENGTREHACGVACGLRLINEHGGMSSVKSAYVTDWKTREAVPLEQASLVVGSDETPDMIPNLIAFNSKDMAGGFQKEHGGKMITPEQAMEDISYVGMSMPFRITPAPTPPQGLFSVGASAAYMLKDDLLKGVQDASARDVLEKKPMAPKKMESTMASLAAGYAVSDDVYVDISVPYFWKKMTSEKKTGEEATFKEEGIGDTLLSGRWRFYHDEMSDQHVAVVGRVSLPSGEFSEENRARPGLQLGTEAFGLGGGLLFSRHIGLFWLNCGAEYRYNFENSGDYKFGDTLSGGVAVHFVPSTKTMLGLEFDAARVSENEDNGKNAPNTGYDAVFGNLVCQRRVATFWGGNFDLRALAGLPLYQHVEGDQLGETYHLAAGMQWKRRF